MRYNCGMKNKKVATSIRLSAEAKALLERLSDTLGISQAAVMELSIREKAQKEGVIGGRNMENDTRR